MSQLLNNAKFLHRLWASLNSDFEVLENKFLDSGGWKFADFAKCCREQEITMVMQITQGKGKTKREHYLKVTDLLIQTAKSFWLRQNPLVVSRDAANLTTFNSLGSKRQLCGFFLTYLMYIKQPVEGRVKITMDIEDLKIANAWRQDIYGTPLQAEVDFIIEFLKASKAFKFQVFADEFRFESETRNYLNSCKGDVIELTCAMRDVQDEVAHNGIIAESQKKFVRHSSMKSQLVLRMTKGAEDIDFDTEEDVDPSGAQGRPVTDAGTVDIWTGREDSFYKSTYFSLLLKCIGGVEWSNCLKNLAAQADKPVLTIQTLTATEAIDRRMMMETRKRIERMRKKIQLSNIDGEQPKASRPYVNEGGIFGRKKETEEGEHKEKRERGLCSGNLWTYIQGFDFGKGPDDHVPSLNDDPKI